MNEKISFATLHFQFSILNSPPMSVENTSNYSPNTNGGDYTATSRSTDAAGLDTLKAAFAQAMRVSLGGGSSSSTGSFSTTETLFQTLDNGKSPDEKRQDQHAEQRQNDSASKQGQYSVDSRKSLDRSELRAEDLESDYLSNVDRRNLDGKAYRDKLESSETILMPPQAKSVAQTDDFFSNITSDSMKNDFFVNTPTTISFAEFLAAKDSGLAMNSVSNVTKDPFAGQAGQPSPIGTVGTELKTSSNSNDLFLTLGQAGQATQTVAQTVSSVPMPSAFSTAIPANVYASASVLTVFTANGRLRLDGTSADDDENINEHTEESSEGEKTESGKKSKKDGLSSLFGTAHLGTSIFETRRPTTNDPVMTAQTPEQNDSKEKTDAARKSPVFSFENENNSESSRNAGISLENLLSESLPAQESESASDFLDELIEEALKQQQAAQTLSQFVPQNTPPPQPTEQAGTTDMAAQIDRIRFVQRVADACQSAANQNGTVRFKLNLDELGPLTIRISTRNHKMVIRFEAATEKAEKLLRENLGELKSTLAEQNIVLEHAEVDLTDGSS